MPLTLGLGQFYSKKMQLEKNVLWHLQVGSCNPEKHYSTIERECLAIVGESQNFKSMYTELNSFLKLIMIRYNTFVVRSFRMEGSCDGFLLYNHIGSCYVQSEER